jgi:alpha-ketoglutarate-dependent 2,4-dichlorophenoxyacetate dioxygenase
VASSLRPQSPTANVFDHSLWHSRKLASPIIYGQPTARELALKPPAHYKLVQVAPDGRKTLFLAAHAKRIVGRSFEDSQKLIWKLIDHCTQPKVSHPNKIAPSSSDSVNTTPVRLQHGMVGRRRHGLVGQQVRMAPFSNKRHTLTAVFRQSMHRANPYTKDMSARDVRRSTIIDDGLLAFAIDPAEFQKS